MNWDNIQSDWPRLRVRAKQRWGKLSNQDLEASEGRREVLAGKLVEAYALSKEDAERQLEEWQRSLDAVEAARDAAAVKRSGTPPARH